MSIFDFESVAVVAELETERFRLVAQSCLEVGRAGVFERIAQRLLPDAKKVFLPGLRQLRDFALCLKCRVKRRAGRRVLNSTFKRFPKIVGLQSLRTQRVNGSASFTQTAAS